MSHEDLLYFCLLLEVEKRCSCKPFMDVGCHDFSRKHCLELFDEFSCAICPADRLIVILLRPQGINLVCFPQPSLDVIGVVLVSAEINEDRLWLSSDKPLPVSAENILFL